MAVNIFNSNAKAKGDLDLQWRPYAFAKSEFQMYYHKRYDENVI